MRRLLVVLGALLAATVLLPAASTSAAPSYSCQYEALEATTNIHVTVIGLQVLVDASWLQRADCPSQPFVDGQLAKFHETSVLKRSGNGTVSGTTYITVTGATFTSIMPPWLQTAYFNGTVTGTYNLKSGGYIAINYATLSSSSFGLKMLDPHQYILLGPMGNLIDYSMGGLKTTITN